MFEGGEEIAFFPNSVHGMRECEKLGSSDCSGDLRVLPLVVKLSAPRSTASSICKGAGVVFT